MELRNFKIADDFIALELGELYLDLHNNYSFEELYYNPKQRELKLYWTLLEEDWVMSGSPMKIRLKFSEVYLFKCHERDVDLPYSEDECLDTLGFIDNLFLEQVAGYSHNIPREGADHLNLTFSSGFAMKIGAKKANLDILDLNQNVSSI